MKNWKIAMFADLRKPSKFPNAFVGEFVSGDSQAHEWTVTLKVGENDADLSGYSAKVYVFRQDGNTVPVDCSISGNRIISVFSAACYAVDGMCTATMKLEKSGAETVSIASVKFRVVSKSSDTYVDPDDVLDLKEAAAAAKVAVRYEAQTLTTAQMNTARANIDAANASLEKLLSIEPQTFTATGNPVQFDSLAGIPLKVTSSFSPVQAGSGDPSPSNIRSISGWTGAKITRCGKNLLRNTGVSKTTNGIMFTVNKDGTITATGTSTGRAQISVGSVTLPAGSYIFSQGFVGDMWTSGLAFISYKKNGETVYDTLHATQDKTLTLTETTSVSYVCDIQRENITLDNLVFYPMIRFASETDAAYVPYQGNEYTVTFGQTIYGGVLNWQTGEVTIDMLMITLEGTESWARVNGSFPYYALNLGELNSFSSAAMLCSHFRYGTIAASKEGENICDVIHSSAYDKDRLGIRPAIESVTSLDTFKEYLAAQYSAGTPVQVVYKLSTPTTLQLTAQEITTLEGYNVLSCDVGTMEVSGRTDVMGVLENVLKRLSVLEAANTQ